MNKKISKIDRELLGKINHMALPLMLSSVTSMIIGLIDMAMVGRISLNAFGAVGLISTTLNSISGVLGMIAVAFNILGAKNKGEGREEEVKYKFAAGIVISLLIGMVFFSVFLCFSPQILKFFYGIKGEVLNEAVTYARIFSLSIGLNMALFMFSSYFKIINRTKYLFYGNLIATLSNVGFDYIFIFGKLGIKPMGVKGAAIASVLALTINILIYIIIVRKEFILKFSNRISQESIVQNIKDLIKVSLSLMGQEVLESTLIVIGINAILARIGVLELSVYNLLNTLTSIILMPMYSYGSTSLTIVSENLGKKDLEKTKQVPKICLVISFIFCISLSVVFILFRNYVPRIITDDISLIEACSIYFVYAMVSNVFNVPNNIYKYSLQGIGDERWVFLNSVIINVMGIILIFIFSIVIKLKLYGVYLGGFINYFMLALINSLRYNSRLIKFQETKNIKI